MITNEIKSKNRINILIIEDNRSIREGWELVFENVDDFSVVGSFVSCEDAFKSPAIQLADIVLMDIGLPGMCGIDGVKYLKKTAPNILVVMCTVFEDDDKIYDAICSGAVGYLLKKTTPDEMIKAIRDAFNGGSPLTPSVARKVISSFQKPQTDSSINDCTSLSGRESQILNLMSNGKSYNTIAETLFLSVDGVRYHIRNIYEKLQVHSRSEAIAEGLKKKIIQPPR
ncbi:MAG: response regulator transcription factor [bacterium]